MFCDAGVYTRSHPYFMMRSVPPVFLFPLHVKIRYHLLRPKVCVCVSEVLLGVAKRMYLCVHTHTRKVCTIQMEHSLRVFGKV